MKSCFTSGFFAATLLAQSASIALGSALPAGYTPVDWIKGDGTSAYYTTDYVPNPETDCIVVEFKFDSSIDTNNRVLFCARHQVSGQNDDAYMVMLVRGGYDYLRFSYDKGYSDVLDSATGFLAGKRCALAVSKNMVAVTDQSTQYAKVVEYGSEVLTAAAGPLWIFASYTDPDNPTAANFSNMALYSFRVYRNGKLVHNLQPVLDANNKPALFDTCENPCRLERFGTFTAAEGTCRRAVVTRAGNAEENAARQSLASSLADVETGTPVASPAGDFDIAYLTDSSSLFGTLVMNAKGTSAYVGQTIVSLCDIWPLRVTPDAAGGGNGRAWSDDGVNAPMTLDEALAAAKEKSVEIWMKKGDYSCASGFSWVGNSYHLVIRGGFSGAEADAGDRDETATSVLNRNGGGSLFTLGSPTILGIGAEFEQIVFTKASGFAIRTYGQNMKLTLNRCRVVDNAYLLNKGWDTGTGAEKTFSKWDVTYVGGVVQLHCKEFRAVDCDFSGNHPNGTTGYLANGGAVGLDGNGSAEFVRCTFNTNSMPNTADAGQGVALLARNSPCTFEGCSFRGNYGLGQRSSVASFFEASLSTFRNCLFAGNDMTGSGTTPARGVLTMWAQNPHSGDAKYTYHYENCTFAYNKCSSANGALCLNQGTATVTNCIFWGNVRETPKDANSKGADIIVSGSAGSYGNMTVGYSLFGGLTDDYVFRSGSYGSLSVDSATCVTGDPRFVTTTSEFKTLFGVTGTTFPAGVTTTFPGFEEAVKLDCHAASFKSLSVNKGDPTSDCSKEPKKNGAPIDLGFYGNTSELPVPATGLVILLK